MFVFIFLIHWRRFVIGRGRRVDEIRLEELGIG